MPTTETNVRNLRINRLTNEQYETAVKSDTELYLTPDTTDADIASAIAAHNSDTTSHSNKQDKLTTQTAYSAKGSATKVPQITTNTLGQVTGITEVTITQPTVNNATLTIQKNGTTVNTFTANASSNVTANITVPTTAADVNAVPTTRTVNSKALSSDITLTASDVGAVATADGVTAVVAGSTDDKINVTKNGSTTTLTINNVANANLAKSVYSVVSAGSTLDIVKASVGTNDYARIQVGGAANAGYLEIATADDADEPIYVRQYTGNFATKTRTLTLLDGSGHTSFPGIVSATGGFNGDNSLLWGGPNIVNGIAPSDTGSIDDSGHNKLSYFPGIIKVEYSTDGGTTWTTPLELSTESKFRLTTLGGLDIKIGDVNTAGVITNNNISNYKARITLCSRNSSGTGVFYSSIRKLLLNVGTNGATGCKVKVERKLISDYNDGNDTWTVNGTYDVGGWTGWNSIPCNFAFGGNSTQTTQTAELRLTLEATGTGPNTANTNAFSVIDIRMIGITNWKVDNFAATGHLYTPDYNKNATFPQRVVASGGFTGDLTGNVTGNVTGDLTGNADTATKATELYENDTRSTNETPLWYSSNHPRSITTEFKSLSKIGITGNGNYGQLVTYTTWTDSSGGYPTQICICSGNGKMFKRNGTANTTWGTWKEIATTDSVGTVTGVTAGAGLNTTSNNTATDGGTISTSGTLYLTKSGVTAGTYQGITVDKYGRVTGASNQGYTTNTGTVTSVRVQAGTGLTSSQNTAQTSTLNTTIGIDSNYKLPTTAEWSSVSGVTTLADGTDLDTLKTDGTYLIHQPTSTVGLPNLINKINSGTGAAEFYCIVKVQNIATDRVVQTANFELYSPMPGVFYNGLCWYHTRIYEPHYIGTWTDWKKTNIQTLEYSQNYIGLPNKYVGNNSYNLMPIDVSTQLPETLSSLTLTNIEDTPAPIIILFKTGSTFSGITATQLENRWINCSTSVPTLKTNTVYRITIHSLVAKLEIVGDSDNNGGGSSRNVGELVFSMIPLTDAGLHLADGALIDGTGIYSAFYNYMLNLYGESNHPAYFTDETTYQNSITTYGVCGKFVMDTTNHTVRLPKITGIVEGTIDATALGDLVEAGLPNITGYIYGVGGIPNTTGITANGTFLRQSSYSSTGMSTGGSDTYVDINMAASRSSSIYKNDVTTVQPQTIKGFYYIVIATSVKTDIEIDIDDVTTDLNNKVDKSSLLEVHAVIQTYSNGTDWYRIYSDGWIEQGGTTYSVSQGNTIAVTYPMAMADTNYCLTLSAGLGSNSGSTNTIIQALSTTGCTIWTGSPSYYKYYVCGYKA